MTANIVKCSPKIAGSFTYRPYSNAPYEGCYAVVRIAPAELTGLAKFLSESLSGGLAHARSSLKIRCYSNESQADVERRTRPGRKTENLIKCYALESKRAVIDGWVLGRMEPEWTPEYYWNRQTKELAAYIEAKIVSMEEQPVSLLFRDGSGS